MKSFLTTRSVVRRSLHSGVGVWLCVAAAGSWAASDGALYQCPRNLFTNQIDEAQAKAQSCTRVLPARLTQAAMPVALPVQAVQAVVQADPVAVAALPGTSAAASPPAAPTALPAAPVAPPVQPLSAAAAAAAPALSSAAVPVRSVPAAPLRVSSAQQRARDQDARTILRAELTRTQAAQLAFQRTGAGAPTAGQTAALSRLREDEAALLRELARFRP